MEWIKVDLYTSSEGLETLYEELSKIGIDSFEVEDPKDFNSFLEDVSPHWDYVDSSLMALKDAETKIVLYLPDNTQGNDMLLSVKKLAEDLKKEDPGKTLGRLALSCSKINEEDWQNNWKQYYKPTRVGKNLVIVPLWENYPPDSKDIVIKMDPGMAFGTGTHATTRLCLELLEDCVRPGARILDLGCGSGILAVCAALLGASRAEGVDIDPLAVKTARENALLNGVKERTHFMEGDLTEKTKGRHQYDIICANIVADVILRLCPKITQYLKPDGIFIASGIIKERSQQVADALRQNGLDIKRILEEEDWVALLCGQ